MKIQEKLLPLLENIDYKIENNELVALPKTRQVEQIIHHDEILEVKSAPAHGIIPAEFDAQGNEIAPMQPAAKRVVAVKGVAAYDEVISVTETYFEVLPTLESVKLACMDISLAVSEYLADKKDLIDQENDSINIVENRIHSFNFKNIPQPSVAELIACFEAAEAKNKQQSINAEAIKYLADTDYMVIRALEDASKPVSEEIKQLRAEARLKIVR